MPASSPIVPQQRSSVVEGVKVHLTVEPLLQLVKAFAVLRQQPHTFGHNLLEHRYRKTDGRSFCIRVTPYSRSGSHINEVLWIFADEEVE